MTVADTIIAKCGGVSATAKLCETTENWVYRWRLPIERGGTGGLVPPKAQQRLIDAAKAGLIDVTPGDFFQGAAE